MAVSKATLSLTGCWLGAGGGGRRRWRWRDGERRAVRVVCQGPASGPKQ